MEISLIRSGHDNSRQYVWILAGLLLFPLCGCTLAKVDVNVVSERTSLENQVLGTYNRLSEDLLLVASVRGVSPTGKIEVSRQQSPEQQDATRALETISFHADDLNRSNVSAGPARTGRG